MEKLVEGIRYFQAQVFRPQRTKFESLKGGQTPIALFITCSDSRINPNLITQTEPGELFILRNAGNVIPPHGAANGGEGATIEFAVVGLGIRDIIICGHSLCGAMKGLLCPQALETMPMMQAWLEHAEATRRIAKQKYRDLTENALLNVAIQENVLVQMDNLRTHPAVAGLLADGSLRVHGWVYEIETGQVFSFDGERGQFSLVTEMPPERSVPRPRLRTALSI